MDQHHGTRREPRLPMGENRARFPLHSTTVEDEKVDRRTSCRPAPLRRLADHEGEFLQALNRLPLASHMPWPRVGQDQLPKGA